MVPEVFRLGISVRAALFEIVCIKQHLRTNQPWRVTRIVRLVVSPFIDGDAVLIVRIAESNTS